jgi:hypothetical protein
MTSAVKVRLPIDRSMAALTQNQRMRQHERPARPSKGGDAQIKL